MNSYVSKLTCSKSALSVFALSIVMLASSSCKKEDEKNDVYKVKFTVNCNGKFKNGNPKIAYTNGSGTTITEELTINKEWTKEVSGGASFLIKAAITGTIDSADVILETEGYKDGNLVNIGNNSQSSSLETPITVKYESTFD